MPIGPKFPPTGRWVQTVIRWKVAEIWNVLSKGKEPVRVSDEDKVDSDKKLKEDESSSETEPDSKELVGSAEMSHFPKDTELELDRQRLSARKC